MLEIRFFNDLDVDDHKWLKSQLENASLSTDSPGIKFERAVSNSEIKVRMINTSTGDYITKSGISSTTKSNVEQALKNAGLTHKESVEVKQ